MTRVLHPDFVLAYRTTVQRKRTTALLMDWSIGDMSRTMHADEVRFTPLMVTRLSLLAESLGYSGPLFADEVAQ